MVPMIDLVRGRWMEAGTLVLGNLTQHPRAGAIVQRDHRGAPVEVDHVHAVSDLVPTADLDDAALRQAVQAAPDGILVADAHGRILYANPTLARQFGYPATELLGQALEVLLPEDVRAEHVHQRDAFARSPRARPMGSGLDLRGRRRDGTEFPVEIGLSPITTDTATYVVALVRDVSERRRAADELAEARAQLALVEDRERIARDLHDTVIQRLFAVGLSLQGALVRAESPELAERLEVAIDEIDGTIRDIRTAIFSLHARRTPTSGPRDDVLAVAREAARGLGFEPHVTFEGLVDTAMPDRVRDHVVPALREALTNVAKHAHASKVAVTLAVVGGEVRLTVVDNGVGLRGDDTGGRGLDNLAARAAELGGALAVCGAEPSGTVVDWRVPVRRAIDDGSAPR